MAACHLAGQADELGAQRSRAQQLHLRCMPQHQACGLRRRFHRQGQLYPAAPRLGLGLRHGLPCVGAQLAQAPAALGAGAQAGLQDVNHALARLEAGAATR